MDLSFSTEERAFEKEVRDFIAQNLTPGNETCDRPDAVGVLRPRDRHGLAASAA